ncbi:hypothetical protein BN2475_40087 [Paraburkholderia ribeironis]|uniref:Uncharacterized protein n=1 Tax=Paraburkholderia ribeironis TaxID=1247936 RepID=A0A1N7RJI2_9BURK|nr:hypothetical protein [Paraburkholderia ribeironis]SIT35271.1 hypothetical protein BN2475_40087 [Paraburkholderia ribeironis]
MSPRVLPLTVLTFDALLVDWRKMLETEGVPFIQTDLRMGLPSFFLPGRPNHWLQVLAEVKAGTIARMEAICKATGVDGYLAIGATGLSGLLTVYAAARPSVDRRRYAQILLNRRDTP